MIIFTLTEHFYDSENVLSITNRDNLRDWSRWPSLSEKTSYEQAFGVTKSKHITQNYDKRYCLLVSCAYR